MITHSPKYVQSLIFQGLPAFLKPHPNLEDFKMYYPQNHNNAGHRPVPNAAHYQPFSPTHIKILLGIIGGFFVCYVIYRHLLTDLLCALLALIFDSYSIQSAQNNFVADIVLLTISALVVFGIYHCLKFHLAVTVCLLCLWMATAFYFSDLSLSFDLGNAEKKPVKAKKSIARLPVLDLE